MIMCRTLCWALVTALAAVTLSAGPSEAEAMGAGPFDFNGDGYADLATGVPGESLRSVEGAGAVQVIYGSSEGLTSKGAQLLSLASSGVAGDPVPYEEFGRALASADVDRDGFAELIVLTTQRIVVLFGSPSGLTGRSQLLTPPIRGSENTYLDAVVLGDFDGDRLSDIAVSTGITTSASRQTVRGCWCFADPQTASLPPRRLSSANSHRALTQPSIRSVADWQPAT